jgi:hypothetical protein
MATEAVPFGADVTLTASLATTPTINFQQMRSLLIRADATVVVTVYAARRDETSRFKAITLNGSDMTLSLTDKFLALTSDQALAFFAMHYIKFVAASGTPTIEFMAKA